MAGGRAGGRGRRGGRRGQPAAAETGSGAEAPPKPPSDGPDVSSDDLQRVAWQEGRVPEDHFRGRSRMFYARADDARASGDDGAARVYDLLGHACSMRVAMDAHDQPFQPMAAFDATRTSNPVRLTRSGSATRSCVPQMRPSRAVPWTLFAV